ncbi:hypothetical protein B0H17DRAFT_1215413 [Mycena rosella]|uniref:Uncharacterized protein n=1 Tax=Mycena rosella TaxID=1033263 RepID=A0AAD7FXW0_MYCRO|nr:hypothetical protein B0H17DRAFT_1215413 [Mycena rosella]
MSLSPSFRSSALGAPRLPFSLPRLADDLPDFDSWGDVSGGGTGWGTGWGNNLGWADSVGRDTTAWGDSAGWGLAAWSVVTEGEGNDGETVEHMWPATLSPPLDAGADANPAPGPDSSGSFDHSLHTGSYGTDTESTERAWAPDALASSAGGIAPVPHP